MSNYEMCNDNCFEIIRELKKYIIEATNIETSPKEMEVLDNICFRMWQLGLTLETKNKLKSLEKENQELKEENEKLKKAIELIKNIFGLKVVVFTDNNRGYLDFLPDYLIDNDLNKANCRLIKEVVESE